MVEERQVPKKKDKLPKRDGHDINKCPTAVISDMCTESFNQYTFFLIKNISSAIIKLLGQSKRKESAADLKVQSIAMHLGLPTNIVMCEIFYGWLLSMDFRLLENKIVRYCTFRLDASEPEFALRLRNVIFTTLEGVLTSSLGSPHAFTLL